MLVEESIVRSSSVSGNEKKQPLPVNIFKAHSPHAQCIVTEKNSYADILKMMQENKTERVVYMKNGSSLGEIFKDDVIARLIDIVDTRENDLESMAHDFKHPLTCIKAINYLLVNTHQESEREILVQKSDEACKYANNLLNDFILSQKIEQLVHTEQTDLNDVIRECLPTYRSMLYKKNQFLTTDLTRQNLTCNLDRIKFHRVIDNLVINAIKFTPNDGEIKIFSRKTGNDIEVEIVDTGIGIATESREKIFERFSTARRPGTQGEQSTGLGLFITQQIVKAHNGQILIDSEVGKGSTFRVQIPC